MQIEQQQQQHDGMVEKLVILKRSRFSISFGTLMACEVEAPIATITRLPGERQRSYFEAQLRDQQRQVEQCQHFLNHGQRWPVEFKK